MSLHTVGHEIFDSFNNKVPLRGWGHRGGTESLTGDWWGPGETTWSRPWNTDLVDLTADIDATFTAMRTLYKSNVIREFVPLDWWWDDIVNPRERYGYSWMPNQNFSYRNYWELILQRARLQNMYINFVPYSVLCYPAGENQGNTIPLQSGGMNSKQLAFMNTIYPNASDPTFITHMKRWWTTVMDRLSSHPNAIFELWNEPNGNIRAQWFTHTVEMYKLIRSRTDSPLIISWWMNAQPNAGEELKWVPELYTQIRNAIGSTPKNLIASFHAYRYTWNLNWAINDAAILAQIDDADWIPQTRSTICDIPLVMGEGGPGMNLTGTALTDELNWFRGLLRACNARDIGFFAYYWLPRVGWNPEQALLDTPPWPSGQSAPTPSVSGQIFIDNLPDGGDGSAPLTLRAVNEDTGLDIAVPVTLDGSVVGNTPGTVQVAEGDHTVSVPPEVDT